MRPIIFAAIFAMTTACSVLDPDDRQALRDAIQAQTPETQHHFGQAAASAPTLKWLNGRPLNDEIVKTQCRAWRADWPTPAWTPWVDVPEPVTVVGDMLHCMSLGNSYLDCGRIMMSVLEELVQKSFDGIAKETMPGFVDAGGYYQCRGVWDPRYEPDKVPGGNRDVNRSPVTTDEMIEWMLHLPAPPPGFTLVELAPLLPYLCPLSDGWSCPDNPAYPGGDGQ